MVSQCVLRQTEGKDSAVVTNLMIDQVSVRAISSVTMIDAIHHGMYWKDAANALVPAKTIDNRCARWSRLGICSASFQWASHASANALRRIVAATYDSAVSGRL